MATAPDSKSDKSQQLLAREGSNPSPSAIDLDIILTDRGLIKRIRDGLRPGGIAPIIRLDLMNKFFSLEFVESCFRNIEILAIMETTPSPLEKLAIYLLMDSAYIEKKELPKHL